MIAPATLRGVIDSRRFADGPWNLGTSGCCMVLVWVELVTVGKAGRPGSLAIWFAPLRCEVVASDAVDTCRGVVS
jgi:hypothetical protein